MSRLTLRWNKWIGVSTGVAMLLLSGCGGGDQPVAPPPVAQNPNPAPVSPYGGYAGGANCAPASGQALPNNPYQSQLNSVYGGSNNIVLTIASAGPLQYGAGSTQRIAAQGQFVFGDLAAVLMKQSYGTFQSSALPPISVCSPGTVMLNSDFSFQNLVLTGTVPVPSVSTSPFGGAPTLGATSTATISIQVSGYLISSGTNSGTIYGNFAVFVNGQPFGNQYYFGQ